MAQISKTKDPEQSKSRGQLTCETCQSLIYISILNYHTYDLSYRVSIKIFSDLCTIVPHSHKLETRLASSCLEIRDETEPCLDSIFFDTIRKFHPRSVMHTLKSVRKLRSIRHVTFLLFGEESCRASYQ